MPGLASLGLPSRATGVFEDGECDERDQHCGRWDFTVAEEGTVDDQQLLVMHRFAGTERTNAVASARPPHGMPRPRTVTVLVTDLVESTRLESRIGPAAADELRREHFGILRAAIGATAGREVKTMGDGLMVVFSGAASAVDCAVRMQQRLERRNRTAGEQLRVRVGIALGDATPEDGDWFGPPVVEAVRLCDRASGGQILASDLVRLVGAREADTFLALGDIELKGLPRPRRVHEVRWVPAPGWEATVPVPARLNAATGDRYVPRVDEHHAVHDRWAAAQAGTRQTVLIDGEPGIGKTRFIAQLARELHDDEQAVVLFGHCAEELDAPYGPFVEALSHLVDHAPRDVLEQHLERHGGALSRLVPRLMHRMPSAPAPARTDPQTERYLAFAAVVGLLEQVTAEAPVVLVLDDLHWADGPTLALLRHLVTEIEDCRILVLGTYRHSDLPREHQLALLLAALRREDHVTRMTLEGLTEAGVVALMELVAGHALDEGGLALAAALSAETDGNPFFVGEILRHLSESGAVKQDAGGRWELAGTPGALALPQSVREVVRHRVERLGPDTCRLLSLAAVIGRDFELEVLARVAGEEPERLLDALDSAVDARILQEHDRRVGWWTFTHNLINQTLYDALGATRQARLHHRVAQALEALCGEDTDPRAAELARHWIAGVAPSAAGKALSYSRRAGQRALDSLAPDEAMRHFQQARALLPNSPDHRAERCDVAIELGEAQRQAGRPEFRVTLLEASRLAGELRDADRAARAALANNRGFASAFGEVDDERVAAIESALELDLSRDPAHPAQRARLLALLAMELQFEAGHERRRDLAERALQVARDSGDTRILPYVLRDRFHAIWSADTLDARRAIAEEMSELADRGADPLVRIWALDRTVHAAAESGELRRALAALEALVERTDELGQPGLRWHATYYAAGLTQLTGDLAEAERLAGLAAARSSLAGEPDGIVVHLSQLCGIRVEQGRTSEVLELLQQAAAHHPRIPAFRSGLAVMLCELGRSAEAEALVDHAADSHFADVRRDPGWSTALALWARATAAVGSERAAAPLYDLLAPSRGGLVWNGTTGYGAVDAFLGMLASTFGAHERAYEHFHAASALHRREGILGWEAHNLAQLARAQLRGGDAARARATAGEARRLAEEHGWIAASRHVQSLVRNAAYEEVR